MEHLSRTSFQCPTHLHHSPAHINAGEKAALAQALAQSLFAHRNTLSPGPLLGNLIAEGRIQEQVATCHPTDSRALRYPPAAPFFALPAPYRGLGRRPPPRVIYPPYGVAVIGNISKRHFGSEPQLCYHLRI